MNDPRMRSAEADAALPEQGEVAIGDAAFRAAVQEGTDAAEAGDFVPYDEVRAWLKSWGTDHELPPPHRS